MNDSILSQFAPRSAVSMVRPDAPVEPDAVDDVGAFGYLRGARERAIMLELRKKDGSVIALAYGWLERVEFDPSEGLSLHFGSQKVKIVGRNLGKEARPNVRLLDGLVRHKVSWIRETDGPELLQADPASLVIETIAIE